jgi:hypothetical protein
LFEVEEDGGQLSHPARKGTRKLVLDSETHIESIPLDKPLLRLGVVEHLVEEKDALLYPIQLFLDLLLVVGLLLGFLRTRTGQLTAWTGTRRAKENVQRQT